MQREEREIGFPFWMAEKVPSGSGQGKDCPSSKERRASSRVRLARDPSMVANAGVIYKDPPTMKDKTMKRRLTALGHGNWGTRMVFSRDSGVTQ